MAVLARSAIRERIATQVATVSGMAESPFLSEQLSSGSPRSASDGRFSVTVGASTLSSKQRQRRHEGVELYTSIRVEFLTNFRVDNATADADAACDRGEAVIAAVMGGTALTDLHLDLVSADEPELVADSPVTICTLTFQATHRIALQ